MDLWTDFSGGLVTNIAYHDRKRNNAAEHLMDCRVDGQGWLVPRPGCVQIGGVERMTGMFTHRGYVFGVCDGELVWGRVDDENQLNCQPFGLAEHVSPNALFFAQGNYVYVNDPAITIEVPTFEEPHAGLTYLGEVSAPEVQHVNPIVGETFGLFNPVQFVFQAVDVDPEIPQETLPTQWGSTDEVEFYTLAPKVSVGDASEPINVPTVQMVAHTFSGIGPGNDTSLISMAVRPAAATQEVEIDFKLTQDINLTVQIQDDRHRVVRTLILDDLYQVGGAADQMPGQQDPLFKQVKWDGRDEYGRLVPPRPRGSYVVAFIERRYIEDGESTFHFGYVPLVWEATEMSMSPSGNSSHVDVFATRGDGDNTLFWVARVASGGTFTYKFPLQIDETLPGPIAFEKPEIHYLAANEFRSYVAEERGSKVYMSHFDPASGERLYRNYTDFIPLELNGGFITGLHFLRDNFLVVYCSNQIQVIGTDPLPENVSVIDVIKARDENDEVIGCIAPQSIVNILGIQYFLATNQYVYTFDGEMLRPISDPVRSIFEAQAQGQYPGAISLQDSIGYATQEHYIITLSETTMVYDRIHGIWWQDSLNGIQTIAKTHTGRIIALGVDGSPFVVYEGETDFGCTVRRVWKSHPALQRSRASWRSAHVYPIGAAEIDVICTTEQGQAKGNLNIETAGDWWDSRMGLDLHGRFFQVQIETDSPVPIDRISVNERPDMIG